MKGPDSGSEGAGPSLALYVHIPWCVRKCPYCDFNSHALRGALPETDYLDTLLRDLEADAARLEPPPPLSNVFIGGGTPSLFSGRAIARLLQGIRDAMGLAPSAEITLEANPGTADEGHLGAYRIAGVNRLSVGVQSLSAPQLERLGRIHGPGEVRGTVAQARSAGFDNLNLDLMYGLPSQTLDQARRDLEEALALDPEHLSYYQLTPEPNTEFHRSPPALPDDDLTADMQMQGSEILAGAGLLQYEISAYARPGRRCRHNLNYWEFGDYLGIGAGAHGKLTIEPGHRVERYWKLRDPNAYLNRKNREHLVSGRRPLGDSDLVLEFAMNALRLIEGFAPALFERRTGLPLGRIAPILEAARMDGLLHCETDLVRPTELGQRFLNDLLHRFAPN